MTALLTASSASNHDAEGIAGQEAPTLSFDRILAESENVDVVTCRYLQIADCQYAARIDYFGHRLESPRSGYNGASISIRFVLTRVSRSRWRAPGVPTFPQGLKPGPSLEMLSARLKSYAVTKRSQPVMEVKARMVVH